MKRTEEWAQGSTFVKFVSSFCLLLSVPLRTFEEEKKRIGASVEEEVVVVAKNKNENEKHGFKAAAHSVRRYYSWSERRESRG